MSGPFCLGQDSQKEAVVLDNIEISDGNEIPERHSAGLNVQWRYEVADDCISYRRGSWKPVQECIARPPRHIHEAVNLRNYYPFNLTDGAEDDPVIPDLLLVGPFISLGDPEMNCHNHPLVWPSPNLQGRAGSQWILGIDDAVANFGKAAAQRFTKENLVPVPIPGDVSRPPVSLQPEATEAENGYRQRPTPRERGDEHAGGTAFLKVPAHLPDVRVDTCDAVPSEDGGDHYWQGSLRESPNA